MLYLDIIKDTKYYIELTKRMITKSIERFKDRSENFSINLSFEDISNGELVKFLKEEIRRNDISKRLILEIVESESIENFGLVKRFIEEMKELGVKIAIDDFGSGYSNFSYLLDMKPDYIKIDGSLIKDIHRDNKSFTIAQTIAHFSKNMDIKVIAEYIHSQDVYEKAKEIGFDGYQGYHLGKPEHRIQGE